MKAKRIIFTEENINNQYTNFEKKMKPMIKIEEGLSTEEIEKMFANKESVISQIEKLMNDTYLKEELGIAALANNGRTVTGNYYIARESYNCHNGYQTIVCTRLTCSRNGKEEDFFGIDFSIEYDSLDEIPQVEILGSGII